MTGAMLGFNGVVVMFLSCYKPDLVKNRDVPAKKNQEKILLKFRAAQLGAAPDEMSDVRACRYEQGK